MASDLTGTANEPFSELDEKIFACIEAAKTWDKDAKLEDFQLRIVANDLVLFNLKTGRTYLIDDEESEQLDLPPESRTIAAAALPRTTELVAHSAAVIAGRSADRLLKWFAGRQPSVSSRAR